MPEIDNLRCSDDDRHAVEQLLGMAYADGRLDKDEFDERSTRTWQAKTFGELNLLTSDLVESGAAAPRTASQLPITDDGLPRATVESTGDQTFDRIVSIMSSHSRKEIGWRFKRHTNVLTVMGDVKLDLTRAVFEDNRCRIDVMVLMGSVVLIVPAGVSIVDKTLTIMGDINEKGLVLGENGPVIEITGSVIMGSINIKGPKSRAGRKALDRRTR